MKENYKLPPQELKRLSTVSNLRGFLDILTSWGAIALIFFSLTISSHPLWYLLCFILISSRQAALANLAHDAWHYLCFSPRKRNDLIAAFLYSYTIGVPYHHDRARHFAHHRRVGFRDDPDWVNYTNETRETPSKLRRYLIGKLLGSLLFSTLWNVLLKSEPRIKSGTATNIRTEGVNEFVWIIFMQLILFVGLYLSIGWWAYPFFWLAPLATLTAFFNNTRAFVEHSVEDDSLAPEQRLKDIGATTLEQHFYSPAHFHLHALHHQYPSIPHHRLEESKSFIIKEAGIYPFQVSEGYWRSLNQHIKSLSKQQADSGSVQ